VYYYYNVCVVAYPKHQTVDQTNSTRATIRKGHNNRPFIPKENISTDNQLEQPARNTGLMQIKNYKENTNYTRKQAPRIH
jgi:hypothetical protein